MWSIENLPAGVSHQGKKERGGTARVHFSCRPLDARVSVWEFPETVVSFSVIDDVLQYGENFEAVQQNAIRAHDAECPGHDGQHHFMVTAGFKYVK